MSGTGTPDSGHLDEAADYPEQQPVVAPGDRGMIRSEGRPDEVRK